jgi:hypothetical protein
MYSVQSKRIMDHEIQRNFISNVSLTKLILIPTFNICTIFFKKKAYILYIITNCTRNIIIKNYLK